MADEKHAHFQTSNPINVPASASSSTAAPIISPSKSRGNKTGTRSTFCPNSSVHISTKLCEADFEDNPKPASKGLLELLGLKGPDNYSGLSEDKPDETYIQSYY
ncbi:hypothetical protein BGX27_008498 [Mortierella sp. AM989]|nr:hypothetical protein BGX27_008498 [Mortierella sp. AM989]